MAEKMELRCYVVSLTWADGMGTLMPAVCRSTVEAGAMAVAMALREPNAPTSNLVGVMCHEIPLEWLRWAARSIEAGSTEPPPTLALVPKEQEGFQPGMRISDPGGKLDGWAIRHVSSGDDEPPPAA